MEQTFFLRVGEHGGKRVEVAITGAPLALALNWRTVTWTEEEWKKGQIRSLKTN